MAKGKANPNPKGLPEQTDIEGGNVVPITHTDKAKELLDKNKAEGMAERLSIIHDCVEKIGELSNQRKAIQANVQAVREKVEALGVSKKAFDMAMAYARMDEEQRQGFDLAYAIARKAIGLPIQVDMFGDMLDGETVDEISGDA